VKSMKRTTTLSSTTCNENTQNCSPMSDSLNNLDPSKRVTYFDSRSGYYYEIYLDENDEFEVAVLWRDQIGQHATDAVIIDKLEDISRLHRRGVDDAIHQRVVRDHKLKHNG
jgi:hypothetical protein